MKVLVFGSANIDRTYKISHFVTPGETLSADEMLQFCGGKGFNQAIAFARAGEEVYFAGAIGDDGGILYDALKAEGINVDYLKQVDGPSGHAIIQVIPSGQNNIIILAGSNNRIDHNDVDSVLSFFDAGDLVVVQNEISSVDYIIDKANSLGMLIAMNPSPYNSNIEKYDLSKVDFLLINEIEGACLTSCNDSTDIAKAAHKRYPNANIVLTLGDTGSLLVSKDGYMFKCGIYKTSVADTTAAGDTFTGYFLSEVISSGNYKSALIFAAIASGISVSRCGASPSIPSKDEVVYISQNGTKAQLPLIQAEGRIDIL